MIRQIMMLYLIDGYPVGTIAKEVGKTSAKVRRLLKEGGIILRPVGDNYLHGRDPVCAAVKRKDYESFHDYVQIRSLDPISEQLTELDVSEKALTRVYSAYRKLLVGLKVAGIVLPTSQISGVDVEQSARDRPS